jgi:hypothetical protein
MNLTIITNNVPRPLVYGFELTEKERAEFDYYKDAEELDCSMFVRYLGEVYALDQFTRHGSNWCRLPEFSPLNEWHGHHNDSFFSGILIRLSDDGETCVMGCFYS